MTLQVLPLLALGWSPIAVPPPAAAVTRGGLLIGASAAGASSGQMVDGARIGPPPDMPSMLLNQRIVYLGLPLSAQVTELIIGQLLYLQYDSSEKPITMYINSPGTTLEVPTETPQLHAPAHCGSLPRPHLRTHLRVLPPRLSPPPASQRLSHPSLRSHAAPPPLALALVHSPSCRTAGRSASRRRPSRSPTPWGVSSTSLAHTAASVSGASSRLWV